MGGTAGVCHYDRDTIYDGPVLDTLEVRDVGECCAACGSHPACACFVASASTSNGTQRCDLLNAQTGSRAAQGVTSGTAPPPFPGT